MEWLEEELVQSEVVTPFGLAVGQRQLETPKKLMLKQRFCLMEMEQQH
jgi:hypothetical protein